MPVILRQQGYRFFFYSNEGDPLQPAHIHVRGADGEAKFWLTPEVTLARNDGFDATSLRKLAKLVEEHRHSFEVAWYEYFAPHGPL